jgi:hypothetical protein
MSVNITLSNNNLGRVNSADDGISGIIVSGVAVSGQFALGDVLGPYTSVADAEADGIDSAYDVANTCLAWQHINDFFEQALEWGVKGPQLYVMVVAKTLTMANICDKANAYAKLMLTTAAGKIRLLAVTRVADGAYTPTFAGQLEVDMWTGIDNLMALRTEEFSLHRPVDFFIEGRNWQGNVSSTQDLRDASTGPDANRVSIVLGGDKAIVDLGSHAVDYAAVGKALGAAAAIAVQRKISRVKNGKLAMSGAATTSNGALLSVLTDAQITSLETKGYILIQPHVGLAGYYFNCDANACPITDDYAYKSKSRPIDKVCRIARTTYLNELDEDLELDQATGRLAGASIKGLQKVIDDAVNGQMSSKGEISAIRTFIDPEQDILTDDEIDIELNIVPKGYASTINVTVGYENPLLS